MKHYVRILIILVFFLLGALLFEGTMNNRVRILMIIITFSIGSLFFFDLYRNSKRKEENVFLAISIFAAILAIVFLKTLMNN